MEGSADHRSQRAQGKDVAGAGSWEQGTHVTSEWIRMEVITDKTELEPVVMTT